MRRRNLLFLFGLLGILTLLTRLPLLWENYFHSDEALFALSAKIWMLGGIPYVDWIETKPLGVYSFYSLASWLSGSLPNINMQAVHLLAMAWTLGTAWTLSVIARKLVPNTEKFWRNPGMTAGLFFVLFSSFWDPTIVSVSIEVVLLLPLCLGIALLPTEPGEIGPFRSFLVGLCAAAAFLCKYQAGILIPVVFIYFWIVPWKVRGSFKKSIIASLFFIIGFIPLPLAMIFYLKVIGAWQGFVFWNFLGNYFYIRDGNAAVDLGPKILTQILRYVGSTLLLWCLATHRLVRRRQPIPPYERLIWIWFFLSFIPVSVGKRFEDHYFLFLTPCLSVLAAVALYHASPAFWKRWRPMILIGLFLPAVGFTVTRFFFRPLDRRFDGEDIASYKPYAAYLKERTDPADPVFLWGCAPSVYLEVERMPASRFLRTDVLAGRVSGFVPQEGKPFDPKPFIVPKTWEMLFDDFRRHPPVYILDMAPTGLHDFTLYPMTNYPPLMEYVSRHYRREASFEKAAVYRRISAPTRDNEGR